MFGGLSLEPRERNRKSVMSSVFDAADDNESVLQVSLHTQETVQRIQS